VKALLSNKTVFFTSDDPTNLSIIARTGRSEYAVQWPIC
jgi:hypothetical protein